MLGMTVNGKTVRAYMDRINTRKKYFMHRLTFFSAKRAQYDRCILSLKLSCAPLHAISNRQHTKGIGIPFFKNQKQARFITFMWWGKSVSKQNFNLSSNGKAE
jgi:hypothetical protein